MEGFASILALTVIPLLIGAEYKENRTEVRNELDSMLTMTLQKCVMGTGVESQQNFLNLTSLDKFTHSAIQTSNFLTSVLINNINGTLDSFTDKILFSLVESNVIQQTDDTLFFIALKHEGYSKYRFFTPYAVMKNGNVTSDDLSVQYEMQGSDTYKHFEKQTFNHITEMKTKRYTMRNYSQYESTGDYSVKIDDGKMYIATIDDGYWTKPYFDCGATDKWLLTFASPILGRNLISGKPEFKGFVATDVDLTNFDVNQCDRDEDYTEDVFNNYFYGTHKCPATTKCQFKPGRGFTTGGYVCICQKGYRFPDPKATIDVFDGIVVENATDTSIYQCIPSRGNSRDKHGMIDCIFMLLASVIFSSIYQSIQ